MAFGGNVHFGMHHVDTSVELLRLPEENEAAARNEAAVVPSDALEEHDLHGAASVLDHHRHALAGVEVYGVGVLRHYAPGGPVEGAAHDSGADLERGKVGAGLRYRGDAAAVHIAEGVEMDEVGEGLYAELPAQQFGPFRPHSAEILDICIQFAH